MSLNELVKELLTQAAYNAYTVMSREVAEIRRLKSTWRTGVQQVRLIELDEKLYAVRVALDAMDPVPF